MIHRLLGVVAAVTNDISRIRINFVPLHIVAMIGFGALATFGGKATRDGLVNGQAPRAVSIAELLDHVDTGHNFVTVSGTLIPEAVFQKTDASSSRGHVEASFVPLLDRDGHRAMLIRRAGDFPAGRELQETQVTGMLVELESGVRKQLEKLGFAIEGLPFDRDYMLEEGARPGNAAVWGTVTGLSLLLTLAMLWSWLRKFTVFRATGSADAARAAAQPEGGIDLRVSGRMFLDQHKRDFVNVPAALARAEDGTLRVLANVDASSRFFGVQTVARRGIWDLEIDRARLGEAELGHHYYGWRSRPALRVPAEHGTAVLSCESEDERDFLWHELRRIAQTA